MSTKYLFGRGYQKIGIAVHMAPLSENLARLRKRAKLSQAQLAERVGVRQNTIAAIESGDTKKTKYLAEISRELGVTINDLDPEIGLSEKKVLQSSELIGKRDFPIHASVEGGEGALVVSSDPVEYMGRPAPLAEVRDAYGVIVVGESMVPLIRPGDIALVHPYLPPRIDDLCLFITDRDGDFRASIKEYRGQTTEAWKVRRYFPEIKDFLLKKAAWPKCHTVIGKYNRR